MEAVRSNTTINLPDYMLADLNAEARRKGITISRLIEDSLEELLYRPNPDTLAAIEECRSGVELENFDPNELDKYIYAETKAVNAV